MKEMCLTFHVLRRILVCPYCAVRNSHPGFAAFIYNNSEDSPLASELLGVLQS
ncbi:hypothetical protein [Prevotella sp. HUN102]|uniref:hypothetical protein n=1 Tax=Prevotella sp. HUN102 TaxID=1392486 RepID=UPI000A559D1F|nr:hypothetical protein [Prevotella sp. HUN102]